MSIRPIFQKIDYVLCEIELFLCASLMNKKYFGVEVLSNKQLIV